MNEQEFRAFLNLMMCSDPWPASDQDHAELMNFAERCSVAMGYRDWVEAYHQLPE
jgi:hypothetical protein